MNRQVFFISTILFSLTIKPLPSPSQSLSVIDQILQKIETDTSNTLKKTQEEFNQINNNLQQIQAIELNPLSAVPNWVQYASATSQNLVIIEKNNSYFAAESCDSTQLFPIYPGDHNLWITDSTLWGYAKEGCVFKQNRMNNRIFFHTKCRLKK